MDFTLSLAFHIPPWLLLSALAALGGSSATIVKRLSIPRRRAWNEKGRPAQRWSCAPGLWTRKGR
jgi:hypothetical protein